MQAALIAASQYSGFDLLLWFEKQGQARLTVLTAAAATAPQPLFLDHPKALVDVKFDRALIPHFEQQCLALVVARDVDTLHDVEGVQRLFTERGNYLLLISVHRVSLREAIANRRQSGRDACAQCANIDAT
jgi:hypothetical protein